MTRVQHTVEDGWIELTICLASLCDDFMHLQQSISSWIELFKDSGAEKEEELLDRREVHDMLQETIDSLTADLGQVND